MIKKKDVPFVEHCNDILQNHYITQGVSIKHDIEYNDGCASQSKCVKAFSSLARRKPKTRCIFCETCHGKSNLDRWLWRSSKIFCFMCCMWRTTNNS